MNLFKILKIKIQNYFMNYIQQHPLLIDIISFSFHSHSTSNNFSTLDSMIVNLKTGNSEYIKLGAAPTYIVRDLKVITIKSTTIPVGLSEKTDFIPISKKLEDKDIIVQISDGVVPENIDQNENYFTNYLKNIDVNKSVKIITDELYKLVLKENKNVLKDDVTIIVTKVKKTKA